jgi:predicted Fe-Mo cluster-binding NifX family protein
MRIAVSADDKNGLDSVVSPHFGRCPFYILVDVKGNQVTGIQEVDSPFYGQHEPGQVPGFIHGLGANVMLAGGMGGRAIMFFEQLGIEGVTGAYGTVRQSVQRYLGGELTGAAPCSESEDHGRGQVPADGEYEEDDVGRLREEAEMLRQQLEDVAGKLDQLNR